VKRKAFAFYSIHKNCGAVSYIQKSGMINQTIGDHYDGINSYLHFLAERFSYKWT
jgi:hypothetical protein